MGRPLLRYKDKLKANIATLGLRNWETIAKDRPKWRATCHKAVADFEKKRLDKMKIDRMNRKHPETSTTPSAFVCDICAKGCKSNAGLSAHKRSHINSSRPIESEQTRTCRICSKVCKSSRGLKLHLRVHRWAVPCSFNHFYNHFIALSTFHYCVHWSITLFVSVHVLCLLFSFFLLSPIQMY